MSCHSESTYSVYVDGELPPERTRELETHLIQCRDCRALVVALREEAELLGDVLHERAVQAKRLPAEAPARGLAIGLLPALGIVALVVAVTGWILETQLPSSVTWLNPLSLQRIR